MPLLTGKTPTSDKIFITKVKALKDDDQLKNQRILFLIYFFIIMNL